MDAAAYDAAHQRLPSRPMPNHTYGRSAVAAAKLHESVATQRRHDEKPPQARASQLRWLLRAEETAGDAEAHANEKSDVPFDNQGAFKKAASAAESMEAYRASLQKFKADTLVEQVEARREQRKPRQVEYASSGRGLVLTQV